MFIHKELEHLNKEIKNLKAEISASKAEIKALKTEIGMLKNLAITSSFYFGIVTFPDFVKLSEEEIHQLKSSKKKRMTDHTLQRATGQYLTALGT